MVWPNYFKYWISLNYLALSSTAVLDKAHLFMLWRAQSPLAQLHYEVCSAHLLMTWTCSGCTKKQIMNDWLPLTSTPDIPTEYLQCVPHILFLPVSHPRPSSFAPDLAATCTLYLQLTKSININSNNSHIHKGSQDCYSLTIQISLPWIEGALFGWVLFVCLFLNTSR